LYIRCAARPTINSILSSMCIFYADKGREVCTLRRSTLLYLAMRSCTPIWCIGPAVQLRVCAPCQVTSLIELMHDFFARHLLWKVILVLR
jgi:hypothetical protein